jgi:hypothetical protein
MLAALNRKHIASAGRLGSGPALGPNSSRTPDGATGIEKAGCVVLIMTDTIVF